MKKIFLLSFLVLCWLGFQVETKTRLGQCGETEESRTGELKEIASQGIPQTVCPVMGGKININHFVDINGKRIYVCCPGCIKSIEAEPEKYIKIMEEQGISLESVPEKKSGE